jgi:hypothetical protein
LHPPLRLLQPLSGALLDRLWWHGKPQPPGVMAQRPAIHELQSPEFSQSWSDRHADPHVRSEQIPPEHTRQLVSTLELWGQSLSSTHLVPHHSSKPFWHVKGVLMAICVQAQDDVSGLPHSVLRLHAVVPLGAQEPCSHCPDMHFLHIENAPPMSQSTSLSQIVPQKPEYVSPQPMALLLVGCRAQRHVSSGSSGSV